MVINRNYINLIITYVVYSFFVTILLSGCIYNKNSYNVNFENINNSVNTNYCLYLERNKESLEENDRIEYNYDDNSFFGIWTLDKVAFIVKTSFYPELPTHYLYAVDINLRNFIGYEIEFSEDFVRIGEERILHLPSYNIEYSNLNLDFLDDLAIYRTLTSSLDNPLTLNIGINNLGFREHITIQEGYYQIQEIIPSYYYDHFEMFEALNIMEGIKHVHISYPEYSEEWWRGELLDHWEFRNGIFRRNPLFHNFFMLDSNHILFTGSGEWQEGTLFLIATRNSKY